MKLTGKNLVQLFTTHISRGMLWKRTRASTARIRRVTAWATKRRFRTRNKADWRPLDRDIRYHGKENIIKFGKNTFSAYFEKEWHGSVTLKWNLGGKKVVTAFRNRYSVTDKRLSLPSTIGAPLPIKRTNKTKTTQQRRIQSYRFYTLTVQRNEDDYLGWACELYRTDPTYTEQANIAVKLYIRVWSRLVFFFVRNIRRQEVFLMLRQKSRDKRTADSF
jgi:hypothetical protein